MTLKPTFFFKKARAAGDEERGITLLLVVILIAALLSISFGIFNVILGQIKISGELGDSFIALFAADGALERILYRDRVEGFMPLGGYPYEEETITLNPPNGCYRVIIDKGSNCGVGINTCITSVGQYRCGPNPSNVIKRGFRINY